MPHRKQLGFTLLELSIVIVIIAFLAGSVVMTKSLIRNARINAMLVEYDQYTKAIKEFQDKYQALPGDMKNATGMWGTNSGGCPNWTSSTSPQIATCNGNGDGKIGLSSAGVLSATEEWWQSWQHLANSGLIEGRYNGAGGPNGQQDAVVGTNIPASKLVPAGWSLFYYVSPAAVAAGIIAFPDRYGHLLSLGGATAVGAGGNSFAKDPIMLPSEAAGIDQKIDDGKPALGNVRVWKHPTANTCMDAAVTADAAVYVTDSVATGSYTCSMYFLLGI